jgi:serine/threonine protein kinase
MACSQSVVQFRVHNQLCISCVRKRVSRVGATASTSKCIVHFVLCTVLEERSRILARLCTPRVAGSEATRGDSELRVRSTRYFVLHTYSMSLSQYLQSSFGQRDVLSLPLVQKILHSVGSALQYLRQHLDVKLDNILVELQDDNRGGRTLRKCVLADFGTARSLLLRSTRLVAN